MADRDKIISQLDTMARGLPKVLEAVDEILERTPAFDYEGARLGLGQRLKAMRQHHEDCPGCSQLDPDARRTALEGLRQQAEAAMTAAEIDARDARTLLKTVRVLAKTQAELVRHVRDLAGDRPMTVDEATKAMESMAS